MCLQWGYRFAKISILSVLGSGQAELPAALPGRSWLAAAPSAYQCIRVLLFSLLKGYEKEWEALSWFAMILKLLEKEMATHSSVLAWRIPGTGEPGVLLSMGSHRVGHDWSDLAAAAADCCSFEVFLHLYIFHTCNYVKIYFEICKLYYKQRVKSHVFWAWGKYNRMNCVTSE